VREHPKEVRAGLTRRHAAPEAFEALDAWLKADERRRAAAGWRDVTAQRVRAGETPRDELQRVQVELAEAELEAWRWLLRLPNLPDPRVPEGATDADNVELRRWGEPPRFDFAPRSHVELGTALGWLDLERATKLSGPRFPLLVGAGARLARAVANLMLDLHVASGYREVAPPHLVRAATLEGSGHLPHFADELYWTERGGLALSPTAEAQLVGMYSGETLSEHDLPLRLAAYAPAFRREAGAAGAATRGLIRQHQFDEVELVQVTTPAASDAAFDELVAQAEQVLRKLELPYRVVALCGGDLPFQSARTNDLEVWMPARGRYVEVSSVSDCGAFQARRARIRYRPAAGGRARYVHTLNGTGLAIGRTIAALLECGQRGDGTVRPPEAVAAQMG
jgi:seryl-tRNA synthetase